MDEMIFIKKICEYIEAGTMFEVPTKLESNIRFKLYKVVTEKGIYIIKLMNETFTNNKLFITSLDNAEELESKLKDSDVPVIIPKIIKGRTLQMLENKYFYVYDYYDATPLQLKDVILEHCKTVGTILGNIHYVDFHEVPKETISYLHLRWQKYLRLAVHKGSPISEVLAVHIKSLEHATELCNNATNNLPNVTAICHKDLTCHNILWQNGEYKVIGTDSLQYDNPYVELLDVALHWSGFDEYKINYNLFNNVTKEYFKIISRPILDWNIIYDYGFKKYLKKIEYNVKKSLMIDCNDQEESKIAEKEVENTIKEFMYYSSIKDEIIPRMN